MTSSTGPALSPIGVTLGSVANENPAQVDVSGSAGCSPETLSRVSCDESVAVSWKPERPLLCEIMFGVTASL